MSQIQDGLSAAEYQHFRDRYIPEQRRIIFVLESPPKSGLYFYDPKGCVTEPLFAAMMKDVLRLRPKTKDAGLCEFAARGFLLIDATYKPVNHPHLSSRDRDALILEDFPKLLKELQKYAVPSTKVVLVKANVCKLLEPKLTACGFTILNRGRTIPFPSTGQQTKFREVIGQVIQLEPARYGEAEEIMERYRNTLHVLAK
jgi:hypothetical protein